MNLTPHFTLEEMTFSSLAQRYGIDNSASPDIQGNLLITAQGLEQVRALLGAPITIDSGFRCAALNQAVNGAKNSAHLTGYAADFLCPGYGQPVAIVQKIRDSEIAFDQLIQEGTWTHISFAPTLRAQVLTAHFTSEGTTYSPGLEESNS